MVVVWVCPETSLIGPKTMVYWPAWGNKDYPAHLRLKFLHNLGQTEERHTQPIFSMGC